MPRFHKKSAFGTADEFYYSAGSIGESVAISHNNTVSDPNEGLHVFGNKTTSPEEFYLVQACFNGPSGNVSNTYQDVTTLSSIVGGPNQLTSLNVNINSGLTPCSYYGIASASINVSISQPPSGYLPGNAWPSSPFSGNNNKSIGVNSVNENSRTFENSLTIYPNPAVDNISLKIDGISARDFLIEIYNILGQSFYTKKYSNQSEVSIEFHNAELNLPNGFYLVKITSKAKIQEGKFIVHRE